MTQKKSTSNAPKKPAKAKSETKKDISKLTELEFLKAGGRFIGKRTSFRSGVRRYGYDVQTEETYPGFKTVFCANEVVRDSEYENQLKQENVKELTTEKQD